MDGVRERLQQQLQHVRGAFGESVAPAALLMIMGRDVQTAGFEHTRARQSSTAASTQPETRYLQEGAAVALSSGSGWRPPPLQVVEKSLGRHALGRGRRLQLCGKRLAVHASVIVHREIRSSIGHLGVRNTKGKQRQSWSSLHGSAVKDSVACRWPANPINRGWLVHADITIGFSCSFCNSALLVTCQRAPWSAGSWRCCWAACHLRAGRQCRAAPAPSGAVDRRKV